MNLNNTKMESQFISYKQALALKELGFDEECFAVYSEYDKTRVYDESFIKEGLKIQAPLWQQAFDWFSNKHNLPVCLLPYIATKKDWEDELVYIPKIYTYEGIITLSMGVYEEARLACLEKLIELCKEKKS